MKFYQYVWKFVYSPLHQNSVVLSCYIVLKKYIYCQYELFFSFITFDFHFFSILRFLPFLFSISWCIFSIIYFFIFLCYFILRLFLVKQNKADFLNLCISFSFFESCINLSYVMLLTFLNLFMAVSIFLLFIVIPHFFFLLPTTVLIVFCST